MKTTTGPSVLTGKEGGELDLEQAKTWIKNHQDRHPHEPHSHYFGKEILQKILNQEGCVGLRFHHGHSGALGEEGGSRHLVITGVTANGSDMMNVKPAKLNKTEMASVTAFDTVGDQSVPCPGSLGCP
ncbi:hypothetical protein [Mucilaginibacter sp. L3T2-6]|uniref:hypothetical protein n=1 Tax=Mucilaginibacter sp. L3T2-6 TaxID=3062491 RepID=UPI0026748CBE|nr:hypothetical protein [Mucilaginibacter sp. L3T2-6]MDO3643809.1 hypothetical protein [Mucilaginibacter sp. L3T2-6]MDV6216260.1 hypothetical protein [Mucilaginibacter sp. L3T2-6]